MKNLHKTFAKFMLLAFSLILFPLLPQAQPCIINDQSVIANPVSVCTGNSSTITVGYSESGINYTLRNHAGNTILAGPLPGTGSALNFNTGPVNSATTFNVLAESDKYSVYLDGGQAGLIIPSSPSLDVTNNFTIEGWIKPDETTGFSRLFNKSQAYALGLSNGQSQITFTRHNAGDYSLPFSFVTGQWYHIACTYAAGTVEFFVNGVSIGTVGGVPGILVQASDAQIGSESSSFHQFRGNIDNVRLWNSVRTVTEIAANQNAYLTSTGNPTLAGSWWISEGSGSTTRDFSANAVHATSLAGTWQADSPIPFCDLQLTTTPQVSVDVSSITLTSAPGSNNQNVEVNSSIAQITYTTTGASGATFSNLPPGVSGNWNSNVITISGTPNDHSGSPYNYLITLTGACGLVTASGTIEVNSVCSIELFGIAPTPVPIINPDFEILYKTGSTTVTSPPFTNGQVAFGNSHIDMEGPTVIFSDQSEGNRFDMAGWAFSSLMGIVNSNPNFDTPRDMIAWINGAIYGGGTEEKTMSQILDEDLIQNTTYDLTADFGWRHDNPNPSPPVLKLYAGATLLTAISSESPPLIKGEFVTYKRTYLVNDPGISGPLRIEVGIAANVSGNQLSIDHVSLNKTTEVYQSACVNTPITDVNYITNGATGAVFSGLPPGVDGIWADNIVTISGTPTTSVGSPFNYTVNLTGGCGTVSASGTISVNPSTPVSVTGGGTFCGGSSTTLTATEGLSSWSWGSFGNTQILGSDQTLLATRSGLYTVTAVNEFGCISAGSTIVEIGDYIINSSLSSGSTSISNRLFVGGVVSSDCDAPKTCQGNSGAAGPFAYNLHSFTNITPDPVCAVVALNANCNSFTFSTVYLESFDPSNNCTNYLADMGSAITGGPWSYEVTIPGGATIVIKVINFNSGNYCSNYRLIVDIPRVDPAIEVSPSSPQCSGSPITLTASLANSYSWSPGAETTQSIIHNTGTTNYTVTLGYGNVGCDTTVSQSVTVVSPAVNSMPDQAFCNGENVVVNFTGGDEGTVYNWTNTNPDIGLAASGSGSLNFGATNGTNSPIFSNISVTPVNGPCAGTPVSFIITVNPSPNVIATPPSETICNNSQTSIGLSSNVPGTTFTWIVQNTIGSVSGQSAGSGNTISQSLVNSGSSAASVTYRITPSTLAPANCEGPFTDVTITVSPSPDITCPGPLSFNSNSDGPENCSGTAAWNHPSVSQDVCEPVLLNMSIDGQTQLSVTPGAAFLQTMNVGSYVVAYSVTDGAANSDYCSFTINIVDNEAPSASCSSQTYAFNGESEIILDPNELVEASDNCGVQTIIINPLQITPDQVGGSVTYTATVTDINGNSASCTANISIGGLPSGWSQDVDGINCNNGNSISYNAANQTWTATSTNCYYANPFTTDAMAFAQYTLCGNGSITALVTGINGNALGWAGVIMRESNAAGAKKVQLTSNLNSNLNRREVRSVTNGPAVPQQSPAQNRFWLRIVRTGNQFVAYNSPNGFNWFMVMTANVTMNECIDIGLVLTNYTQNSTVTATFSNVSIQGGIATLPAPDQNNTVSAANDLYDFEVYPNPSSGELFIEMPSYAGKAVRIELYNTQGQMIHLFERDKAIMNVKEKLHLSGYAPGMYFIKLKSEGLQDATKRIVLISGN